MPANVQPRRRRNGGDAFHRHRISRAQGLAGRVGSFYPPDPGAGRGAAGRPHLSASRGGLAEKHFRPIRESAFPTHRKSM